MREIVGVLEAVEGEHRCSMHTRDSHYYFRFRINTIFCSRFFTRWIKYTLATYVTNSSGWLKEVNAIIFQCSAGIAHAHADVSAGKMNMCLLVIMNINQNSTLCYERVISMRIATLVGWYLSEPIDCNGEPKVKKNDNNLTRLNSNVCTMYKRITCCVDCLGCGSLCIWFDFRAQLSDECFSLYLMRAL